MHRIGSIRPTQTILAGVLIGMMLLITACGGSPQSQAQVNQNKARLDQTLQHGRSIGIPDSALQSIIKQEQQQRKVCNTQAFSTQYNKDASLLASAQYPKDFAAISRDARKATETLALSSTTFNQLNRFNTTIHQMKAARLDVTAMQTQYQNDLEIFNIATTSIEFQNLGMLLN